MPKQTKEQKITELQESLAFFEECLEKVQKKNKELIDAEEETFLHSPTYLQMKEKIAWIENLNKLNDIHIASLEKRAYKVDDTVRHIYEDNRCLLSEKTDIDYFVGITSYQRDIKEYLKLEEQIAELKGKIEQKSQAISDRDSEIERLQLKIVEQTIKIEQDASVSLKEEITVSVVDTRHRGGR